MINMTKQEKMNDREIKNLAKNWSYGRYSNENSVIEKYNTILILHKSTTSIENEIKLIGLNWDF